jgi:fatty-acyl-CoA synthase
MLGVDDLLGLLPKEARSLLGGGLNLVERFGDEAYFAAVCIRSGMVRPELPHKLAQMLLAFERHGLLAGAVTIGGIRHGDRVAIRDERGDVTYRELDQRTNAIANAWRQRGLEPGSGVAILVRNHRGFLEAVFAAAKCGAKIILLNTSFAAPQIREVADREGTDLLVYDDEYSEALEGVEPPHGRWRAWVEEEAQHPERVDDSLESLIDGGDTGAPPGSGQSPKIVILTSGTTGTPKGAPRDEPRSLGLMGGLLSKVPFRARQTTELAVPMFHALGFASMALGLALGSTLVIRRHFDPDAALDSLQDNEASALVVVPVMLQRMLELGDDAIAARDLSHLKVIFVSGSALSTDLVKRSLKAFGPVVYNMYGSTEIAYATIATPRDLQEEPASVGKIVRGVVVKLFDDDGHEVTDPGATGRIFVGNSSQFEGYTGGETKEQLEGLMSSGDVGHFDEKGRLFIDGRDDEMIVSGGENVFPAEVEELLTGHEAIDEAAAIGVDDEKFGQRLKAFVVLRDGGELSEDDIKDYVKENLARYKVPREVVFLDELPRNPTGKVLKRELEEGDGEAEGSSESSGQAEGSSESSGKAEGSSGSSGQADGSSESSDGSAGSSDEASESSADAEASAAGRDR